MKWMMTLLFVMSPLLNAGEPGKGLYATCAACHGVKGEGNKQMNAPALAGQEIWYTMNQLANYKAGIRGTHPQDTYGAQMRPMAMITSTEQMARDVATYINKLKPVKHKRTMDGDPKAGRTHFATCTACHGPKGKGMESMKSPDLTLQQDWYIYRQMEYFKKGIRGAHKDDVYGAQMRPMSMVVPNDQALKDLVAYITTLAK